MDNEYEEYLEREWWLFAGDAGRHRESLEAVAGVQPQHVLDVGCGAGQEMIPFAAAGARCVGVDIAEASSRIGTRLFAERCPGLSVEFVTAAAERLPFADAEFDVVLCRVVIPYTNIAQALQEIARVLRAGGVLLLKTHDAQYYLHKFVSGLRRGSPLFSLHALRVLVTGTIYHTTGLQPSGGLLLRETFLTSKHLARELSRVGLAIDRELPDSNALTPSYRIVKWPSSPNGLLPGTIPSGPVSSTSSV